MSHFARPGPYGVTTHLGEWQDSSRGHRVVPWLLRLPATSAGAPSAPPAAGSVAPASAVGGGHACPVVVMSHGLGGMREGLSRLSAHLVSHGFAVLHVQHAGSDIAIWSAGPAGIAQAMGREAFQNRMMDIPFALQQLRQMNASGPFARRFDMDRVAMAGHSYGAIVTQLMAGEKGRFGRSWREPTFKAFVVLSPSDHMGCDFRGASGPFLFVTGTHDVAKVTPGVTPESRLKPFHALPEGVPASLMVLKDGDHYTMGDGSGLLRAVTAIDPVHFQLIDAAVLSFLQCALLGDRDARAWLTTGGLSAMMGGNGRLEQRGW